MTAAVDLLLRNGHICPLGEGEERPQAVAIRDGRIVAVGRDYDLQFRSGVSTREIDLRGAVVVPGFVDAHTHLKRVGRRERFAELRDASGPEAVADRLRAVADRRRAAGVDGREWVLGFGYDDATWDRPLRGADLPSLGDTPIAAFREDMHSAVLNEVAFDLLSESFDPDDVEKEDGSPTGVVVEDAVGIVESQVDPDKQQTRELLAAGQRRAHRQGITGVHEMTADGTVAWAWRALEADDELALRVRLYHHVSALDAIEKAGQYTNHGSELVRFGGIKVFVDGSIGSRTARLSTPYADSEQRGRWVTEPTDLEEIVGRASDSGFQLAIHAIGDAAIDAVLDALASTRAGTARHRIEHLELATDDQLDRLETIGAIASVQPNFHQWAGVDGLYDRRLGGDRRRRTNRLGRLADTEIPVAFGSDGMPLGPLFGLQQAVSAPTAEQRTSLGEALRSYTRGAAYAGFDETRTGRIEPGFAADLTILDADPWAVQRRLQDIDVVGTIVAGKMVYHDR